MRILIVTQYFWPENFKINDLCEALIKKGHEVTVYTGLPNYPTGRFFPGYSLRGPYHELHGEIKVIRVPIMARGENKSFQLLLNYLSYFISASLLAPFLVRGKFDKIFVYEPSPITVVIPAIVLRFIKKAPLFFWVQDLWPESLEATGIVKNKTLLNTVGHLVKVLYSFSDRILVTSKGFIPRVKALGGRDEQIIYFPQWAEDIFNKEADSSFHDPLIPQAGFKVMFAGNIGTSQDFETIVAAAKILKKNKEIVFLILGDGLMKSWAQNEVANHDLSKNFIFLGRKPLETMPDYYAQADVMLLSLKDTELFSITVPAKLQSYLACGKPILASINGEGAQLIDEAKAGITVNAGKADELAKALIEFSTKSSHDLKEMGENARTFYQKHFERESLISFLEKKMSEVTYE